MALQEDRLGFQGQQSFLSGMRPAVSSLCQAWQYMPLCRSSRRR